MPTIDQKKLPPILYKFYPIESWLPQLFAGESISFSSRLKFNDPFDCRPGFKLDSGAAARKYLHDKFRSTTLSASRRIGEVERIMRKNGGQDSIAAEATQHMLDEIGILCLTTKWDNALMWAHYAKDHTGICIGFKRNVGIFHAANPVRYSDDFPIIVRPRDTDEEMFQKTFLTKAKCWNYEDEWRITKNKRTAEDREDLYNSFCISTSVSNARQLADLRGAAFYQFDNSAIESVTLGMRCDGTNAALVKAALKSANLAVPLYQVTQPSTTYLLARQLVI